MANKQTTLAAMAVAAIHVNRFHVLLGPEGARLVFGEIVMGKEFYHVAVRMSPEDLLDLSQVIGEVAEAHRKALAETKKKAH